VVELVLDKTDVGAACRFIFEDPVTLKEFTKTPRVKLMFSGFPVEIELVPVILNAAEGAYIIPLKVCVALPDNESGEASFLA